MRLWNWKRLEAAVHTRSHVCSLVRRRPIDVVVVEVGSHHLGVVDGSAGPGCRVLSDLLGFSSQ